MFTFGASREAYSRVYCQGRVPHDRDIPGPGTYGIPQRPKEGKVYSISKKLPRECKFSSFLNNLFSLAHVAVTSSTPGPGTYNNSLKNYNGNPVFSGHKNYGTPLLKLPIK